MFRRSCLLSLLTVAGAPAAVFAQQKPKVGMRPYSVPGHPDFPQLRAGTQLDFLYEGLLANGFGIANPKNRPGNPTVVIAFDTQCAWCNKLFAEAAPLAGRINFVWFPVATLRDLSVTQAAAILASENPWQTFELHEAHFKDPEFKGLNPAKFKADPKANDKVWTNTKLVRWSGTTVVPLGAFKNKEERYLPLLSGSKTADIEKLVFG